MPSVEPRTLRWLFVAGVAAGLLTATIAALGPLRTGPLPASAVARVDGVLIDRATYDSAIAGLTADKRNALTHADRMLALDRLIDEELLVQRGVALGLAERDGSVRKALVDAMLQFAAAEAAGQEPGDADLRRFYDTHPHLFASSPQLRLAAARLPAASPAVPRLAAALRGGSGFGAAVAASGASLLPMPDGFVAAPKIADYAGPAARDAAIAMQAGDVAGPVVAGDQALFLYLTAIRPGDRLPFDTVQPQLREAWRREAQDKSLETYLADLRRRARIDRAAIGTERP